MRSPLGAAVLGNMGIGHSGKVVIQAVTPRQQSGRSAPWMRSSSTEVATVSSGPIVTRMGAGILVQFADGGVVAAKGDHGLGPLGEGPAGGYSTSDDAGPEDRKVLSTNVHSRARSLKPLREYNRPREVRLTAR